MSSIDPGRIEALIRETIASLGPLIAPGTVISTSGQGRRGIEVVLTPPADTTVGEKRWSQAADAVRVLLEISLAHQGLKDASMDVRVAWQGERRLSREEGLAAAVRRLAEKATRLERPFAIGPMSVNDRRFVHQVLGEVPSVWTQSEGEGIFRRLWVVPRKPRAPESAS